MINPVVVAIVLVLLYLIIARPAMPTALQRERVENLDERLVKYLGYAQEMAPTNTGISYRTA